MDTFENSMSTFDQGNDAQSFVDYLQQQHEQENQQNNFHSQSQSPALQISSLGGGSSGSTSGHQNPTGYGTGVSSSNGTLAGSTGYPAGSSSFATDIASPASSLLRSSASPTTRDQALNVDSASTTLDSTISFKQQQQQQQQQQNHYSANTSPGPPSTISGGGNQSFTSYNSLHPGVATPVRHNSLPFGQQSISGHDSNPGGIQFASSSNPNSPSMSAMRPMIAVNTMMQQNQYQNDPNISSPSGSDFLNPNNPLSASPSPLRSSIPFQQSPEQSGTASPTHAKSETDYAHQKHPSRSHTVPSQPASGLVENSPLGQSTPVRANSTGGPGAGMDSMGSGGNGDNASSTKFVHKLFRMVSDPEYQHLISWNANGTSVVVTNFDEFAKEVLGKHFKHSNFSSFIRQLNMYGFYKVNKTPRGHRHAVDTQIWEFSHPKFIRGRPDLLDDIRRKALDSEHARVEARDLQYSVSVGHMQLRQQVDEQQYRLEEMLEMNIALRNMVLGMRDSLANVLDWIKVNNGGQLPFDARLPMSDLPPTPMIHPFMAERPPPPPWMQSPNPAASAAAAAAAAAAGGNSSAMLGHGDMSLDGPSIFITEPGYQPSPHDVFSLGQMGQVSPMASRRVSTGSQASERVDMQNPQGRMHAPPRMSIDTALATTHIGSNPGLGVMGLPSSMNSEMQVAVNTPLPPSPLPQQHGQMGGAGSGANTPYGMNDSSSFFNASPSMATFPNQGYFAGAPGTISQTGGAQNQSPLSPQVVNGMTFSSMQQQQQQGHPLSEEDGSMLGPNAKSMRTQIKRTASNSGVHQMGLDAQASMNINQQKRKSPGL